MLRSTRTTRGPCPTSAARPSRSALGLGLDWPLGTAESVRKGERPWRGRLGEAGDWAVPGRWEGDLLIGKDCKSAAGTLVERTTRSILLLHLPARRLPGQARGRRSPPGPPVWPAPSPGTGANEMAYRVGFTIATGIPACFCQPHKRWQRGSNENTYGLLHQKVRVAAHPRIRQYESTAADPGGDVTRATGPRSGRAAGRRNTGTPGSCGPGRRRTKSMTC